MTISSSVRTAGPFSGNGVTTVFPFAFKIFANSDLQLVSTNTATGVSTTLAITADYTVNMNGDQNASPGGSIMLNVALATGLTLVMTSSLAYLQATDLTNGGGFYPSVITAALDRLTIFCQQLLGLTSRALRLPLSDVSIGAELPNAVSRANNLLGFDASGNPVAIAPAAQSATALQTLLAGSAGSSIIGYIQSGAGAVASTDQAKLRERKTIKVDFGAVGNGATDNTAILQSALNSLVSGDELIINGGNFVITGPLTCAASDVTIRGQGDNTTYGCAIIASGANGYTMLTLTGDEVVIEGISFLANPSLMVGGAGATRDCLKFTGDVNANIDATVRNCSFAYANHDIVTTGRNINIYDNIFSNSKIGILASAATSGECRDFIIQRNRFHTMGDAAGSTFCIELSVGASIFETQILNNFYDGQGYALFVYGQSDDMMICNNRISIPHYKWIDVQGNVITIDGNVFDGNITSGTGSGISIGPGSDIYVRNNVLNSAPYQGIVTTSIQRFDISHNSIASASYWASTTYDAIQLDGSSSNGIISFNLISNGAPTFANHGISGNPINTFAYGNKFFQCAGTNINSTTLYNTALRDYGVSVEGSNGAIRSEGTKYRSIGNSGAADVAYIDFDSVYGACIAEVNASMYGSAASQSAVSAKRYITFVNGAPVFTTIGADYLNNATIAFTYVGTAPNRIKITITNGVAETVRGGVCIEVKGGGSNVTGLAGATLTML